MANTTCKSCMASRVWWLPSERQQYAGHQFSEHVVGTTHAIGIPVKRSTTSNAETQNIPQKRRKGQTINCITVALVISSIRFSDACCAWYPATAAAISRTLQIDKMGMEITLPVRLRIPIPKTNGIDVHFRHSQICLLDPREQATRALCAVDVNSKCPSVPKTVL